MSTLGVFSTPGGTMSTLGGYHEGVFSTVGFPYTFNCFPNNLPPHLS